MMAFAIRRATSADAVALAALAERTFVDTFAASNRPEDVASYIARSYGEEIQRSEIEDPSGITLVVEAGDTLVAFAQLLRDHRSPAVDPAKHAIFLSRFYLDRAWHGRGLAHSLMRSVVAVCRDEGAELLWLTVWEHNARAIAFYRKCGFAIGGTEPFLLGSDLQTDHVMLLPLD